MLACQPVNGGGERCLALRLCFRVHPLDLAPCPEVLHWLELGAIDD
jgi:hypothetical protein